MATSVVSPSPVDALTPVAPWWHTLLVILPMAAGSVMSWRNHALAGVSIPGLGARLSNYLVVFAEEWLLVLVIWLWLRHRGLRLGELAGGRWRGPGAFFRDLGIAVGFVAVTLPVLGILIHFLFGKTHNNLTQITPKTVAQLCAWIVLCATAGFCEEMIFRGYLRRQFSGWTGSAAVGLIAQAVLFGLAHGYYHGTMVVIMLDGLFYGLLAQWRKSLRPGMLAHGLQDTVAGLASYLS